jgi:hypothetical protein
VADHTVATNGEWDTLFANSDSFFDNKTVAISGSAITEKQLTSRSFTNLTLESANASSTMEKLDLVTVSGLTLDGLRFRKDASGEGNFIAADSYYMLAIRVGCDVAVTNCHFDGDCATGDKIERWGGIRCTESACPITDCTFVSIRDGVVLNECHTADGRTATVTGCSFSDIFEDAITGIDTDWIVNDNTATEFNGVYGKRYYGTITGTISVGETLSNGEAGDAEKIIEVVDVQSGYIDGNYNNFAPPSVSETYTGASGSFEITSITSEYDSIHGDFFQPLMNTATADRTIECQRNFVYRTNAYTHDSRNTETNVQGILAQLNGSSYNWSTITFRYNVISGGQPIGISIEGALGGVVQNNTILWSEYGFPSDIRIWDSENVTLSYNAGDNNTGGVIDIGAGGNTNLTITNNVFVDGDDGTQETVFDDPFAYPQTLSGLAPVASEAVDNGDAGALTTAGAFRTEIGGGGGSMSTPSIVESSPTYADASGTDTLSLGTFTAGSGDNRKVIAVIGTFDSNFDADTITADWGGEAGELIRLQSSQATNYENAAAFQWQEANFPSGATGTLSFSLDNAASNMTGAAFTVKDTKQDAATAIVDVGAESVTTAITPAAADSLVIGVGHASIANSGMNWSAGLTRYGEVRQYGSTGTVILGQADQDDSELTVTHNLSTGRPSVLAFALEPVSLPSASVISAFMNAGASNLFIVFDGAVSYSGGSPYPITVTNGTGSTELVTEIVLTTTNTLNDTLNVVFSGDTPQAGDTNWTCSNSNSAGKLTGANDVPIADFTGLAVSVLGRIALGSDYPISRRRRRG